MMGLSKMENREKKKKEEGAILALDEPLDGKDDGMRGEGPMSPDGIERNKDQSSYDDEDEDDVPFEYVPEQPNMEDTINRVVWKPDNRNHGEDHKQDKTLDAIPLLTQRDIQNQQHTVDDGGQTWSLYRRLTDPVRFGFTASTSSSWDDLFGCEEEVFRKEGGLDDLLDLFHSESATMAFHDDDVNTEAGRKNNSSSNILQADAPTTLSMLSPVANRIARDLISKFSDNSIENVNEKKKVKAIEMVCPNWKENITFALVQKDPTTIQQALQSLREYRESIKVMTQRIQDTLERRCMALDMYETALEASAARLTTASTTRQNEEDDDQQQEDPVGDDDEAVVVDDGGFLTQAGNNEDNGANDNDVFGSLQDMEDNDIGEGIHGG